MVLEPASSLALPTGTAARPPAPGDVGALTALVAAHRSAAGDPRELDPAEAEALATGTGSWTRREVVVVDSEGTVCAWAWVHDRAAGRADVDVTVSPSRDDEDEIAAALLRWAADQAAELAAFRKVRETRLDGTAYVADARQKRWFAAAGYELARTWHHMVRPVEGAGLPAPRQGVVVRRVATHEGGMPVAHDLQVVHRMLEESFADHFNSYRESFPEFLVRLREHPGHRWDHWWIADVEVDGQSVPGGALVSSVLPADEDGLEGSYIDYIGVHRRARGLGVAKALLATVVDDAARRGRNRVELEVDADSPTGADGLYRALGWHTAYSTQSWHADLHVTPGA